MAWVRIDDGFVAHPKIVQLTDAQFRVWMKVLCYCASVSDPTVDRHVQREIPGLTPNRIGVFSRLELLDDHDGVYEVHDWPVYAPKDATGAERQAAWRARKSEKTPVTDVVTPPVTDSVTQIVTPSRAPATEPDPNPAKAGNEDLVTGSTEASYEGKLPFEKLELATKLKAAAPVSDEGAQHIDDLVAELPLGSSAKVLESVVARNGSVGAGYVINALRSERDELAIRRTA